MPYLTAPPLTADMDTTDLAKCRAPDCPLLLVPGGRWRRTGRAVRRTLTARGVAPIASRGLCTMHRRRLTTADELADYPTAGVPAYVVAEEWAAADHSGDRTRAEKVRQLAPRLGMTPDALDRALDRLSARGQGAA